MKKQNRIVVVGGMGCGAKAAARARRLDAGAEITLIEQGEDLSVAACGLPYYISGRIEKRDTLVVRKPDFFSVVMDTDVLIRTRALSIDRAAHKVEVLQLKTNRVFSIEYDKLVLATGCLPVTPAALGVENIKGVFTLTRIEDAEAIRGLLIPREIKKAVIVGGGLIGMEVAEAFVAKGLEVTMFEAMDRVLPALFDFEIAAHIGKHLREKGVDLRVGQRVTGLEGDSQGWVRRVIAEGTAVEAGLVLVALGTRPNIKLARDAGLAIGASGGIAVDGHLQTSDSDIYAGGDCVENTDRITGRKILAPLGSTANKHGRVIGTNVTGGNETFPGVLGTAIAKVFDCNVARVGLSEAQAREVGYEVVTCLVPSYESATYYPGAREILVKLVADRADSRLLGGQVVGRGDVAKRIDVLVTALTFGATVDDMTSLDLAYAPPYNGALDALHHAANVIRNKLSGLAKSVTPMEVKKKLDRGDDFIFLDVRTSKEWKATRIEAPQVRLLPLGELRGRLHELPRDAEIVTFCRASVRAYQAQRILEGEGFTRVSFMDGSTAAWPYEITVVEPPASEKGTSNS